MKYDRHPFLEHQERAEELHHGMSYCTLCYVIQIFKYGAEAVCSPGYAVALVLGACIDWRSTSWRTGEKIEEDEAQV